MVTETLVQRIAAKAVIEAEGGILVLRPSEIDANRKWHIPGGIRDEISEPLGMTAVREVLEETSIDLNGIEGKVFKIGEWGAVDKGEKVKILAVFFRFVLPERPQVLLSDEHVDSAWLDRNNHHSIDANPEVYEIVDELFDLN